jgi:F420-dependent oxidoreductase-like protein
MDIALMVEGQDGLTWERWQRIGQAAESLGFAGLYRSDHYTNAKPPDKESLELWVSLTWLAGHTQRIEFGPLVSPVSFRHPTMTARMATAVDDLSGGRLHLGLGAGWQEREHTNFGWNLLDVPERFARFEEGLEVISLLLGSDEPVDYEGVYYELHDAILLPRPQRAGGPPLLIGGNGPQRTLPLVAKYAQEWNGVFIAPQTYAERNRLLDELLAENGRAASEVRRSLMTGCVFGHNASALQAKLARYEGASAADLNDRGLVAGDGEQVQEQLARYAAAGVQRIMLQWLDLDDMEGLEALASAVLA